MGYTTFTGPIRAGNILNTTGDLPGVDVGNVGQVIMAQAAAIAEDTSVTTTISIPAGSQILSIELRTTINFTNPVSIGGLGTSTGGIVDATYFSNATGTAPAVGMTTIQTTTTTQNTNWISVGVVVGPPASAYDVQVVVAGGAATGPGRGILTITYLQGPNGNT